MTQTTNHPTMMEPVLRIAQILTFVLVLTVAIDGAVYHHGQRWDGEEAETAIKKGNEQSLQEENPWEVEDDDGAIREDLLKELEARDLINRGDEDEEDEEVKASRPQGIQRAWSSCKLAHCKWTPWTEWSYCSHPCGGVGTQSRTRHIAAHEKCGGIPCTGPSVERRQCNRFCMNGGRLMGDKCHCSSNFRAECCHIAADWTLLFRSTAGSGAVSPYHLWKSDMAMNAAQKQLQTTADLPKGVYKSPIVEEWKGFSRVKLAFYTGGSEVAYVIFNASTSKSAWFLKTNILDSTYSDINSVSSNFLKMDYSYLQRRFIVAQRIYHTTSTSSTYCNSNRVNMMVEDIPNSFTGVYCTYDIKKPGESPVFLYSDQPDTKDKHRRLMTGATSSYMKRANVMAIFGE